MVTIRLARQCDVQNLCEIEESAWSLGGEDICASPEKIKARIESYRKGVSIATYNGMPCGSQYAFRFMWNGQLDVLSTWDEMTCYGNTGTVHLKTGNTGFLVGVGVVPEFRGRVYAHNLSMYTRYHRVSELLIAFTLENLFQDGVSQVIGCARIPWYSKFRRMSVSEYCATQRADGFPYDPVLRFHVRMGAKIVKPVGFAMDDPESLNAGCWVQYDRPFTG